MSIDINTYVNAITFSTLLLPIILHEKSRMRRRVQKSYFKNWSSQWYSYLRNVIDFCFVLCININSNTSLPISISILFLINQIKICIFSRNLENILFLLFSLLLFFKKAARNNRKPNNTIKERISTIFLWMVVMMIITLLMINVAFMDTCMNVHQIHKLVTKYRERSVEATSFHKIVYQFVIRSNVLGTSILCERENIEQGRSYLDKNINISNCFFIRSGTFSDNGGVIYVNGGTYSMSINCSLFYNCSLSQKGGAIYFVSSDSNLRMVCADSCSASSNGHFALIVACQSNIVEILSVSYCSHLTTGYSPLSLDKGNQKVFNLNSSSNKAERGSGISCYDPASFQSVFCTFSSNKVSDSICIYIYSVSGIISMSYSNIVHNNSPSGNGVIFVNGAGARIMMYCIFQNNQNYLFCLYSGYLEVSHSFIDLSSSISTSLVVTTSLNNYFTKTQTVIIEGPGSHICKIPNISQTITKGSTMIWLIYSIVSMLFIALFVILYIYRSIATDLQIRHLLEDRLQNDFG